MNKELAIEVARGVLEFWRDAHIRKAKTENTGSKYKYTLTPEKLTITAIYKDKEIWKITDKRPHYESLNPDKGLLLFLKAIYTLPGLKSWKNYCIMTGNKITSFGTLRGHIMGQGLVTDKYQVTEAGKRLLEAYELI